VPRAPAQGGARQLESAVSHVTQMPAFVYVIARCDWRVIYWTPTSLSVATRRIAYPDAVVSLSEADLEQLTVVW
jgi:hypothetical protein